MTEPVKRFTGLPPDRAETVFIGGIHMDRNQLAVTIDLGIRVAVLCFMLAGGIVAFLPIS